MAWTFLTNAAFYSLGHGLGSCFGVVCIHSCLIGGTRHLFLIKYIFFEIIMILESVLSLIYKGFSYFDN